MPPFLNIPADTGLLTKLNEEFNQVIRDPATMQRLARRLRQGQ